MADPDGHATTNVPEIPIEIVTDEEMALIEAAFAATRSSFSSSVIPASSSLSPRLLQRNARSIDSITRLSKRRFSDCGDDGSARDIEDFGRLRRSPKRIEARESPLHRFRRKKGLSVTDITRTVLYFCEKFLSF